MKDEGHEKNSTFNYLDLTAR